LSPAPNAANNGADSGAFRSVTAGYRRTGCAACRTAPSTCGRGRALLSISGALLSFGLRLRDCHVGHCRHPEYQSSRSECVTDADHVSFLV